MPGGPFVLRPPQAPAGPSVPCSAPTGVDLQERAFERRGRSHGTPVSGQAGLHPGHRPPELDRTGGSDLDARGLAAADVAAGVLHLDGDRVRPGGSLPAGLVSGVLRDHGQLGHQDGVRKAVDPGRHAADPATLEDMAAEHPDDEAIPSGGQAQALHPRRRDVGLPRDRKGGGVRPHLEGGADLQHEGDFRPGGAGQDQELRRPGAPRPVRPLRRGPTPSESG